MARHASKYRKARRDDWKIANAVNPVKVSWSEYNERHVMPSSAWDIKVLGTASPEPWWHQATSRPKPSKDYRGKMGAKDKAGMDRSK